jgi:hypothetical protein
MTAYKQRQTLLDWLFASIPGQRSTHTLPTLHRTTLIHGLTTLRQRITDLIDLDIRLYHRYASLLTDKEYVEKAFAYAGWVWVVPPAETLEMVGREEVVRLLWQDVQTYDEVARSARMWKMEVDGRIGRVQGERERRPWEV